VTIRFRLKGEKTVTGILAACIREDRASAFGVGMKTSYSVYSWNLIKSNWAGYGIIRLSTEEYGKDSLGVITRRTTIFPAGGGDSSAK
jgi:hypothetical protein